MESKIIEKIRINIVDGEEVQETVKELEIQPDDIKVPKITLTKEQVELRKKIRDERITKLQSESDKDAQHLAMFE